jgi:predicted lipoprotein with Yx(FWY)xxD motif
MRRYAAHTLAALAALALLAGCGSSSNNSTTASTSTSASSSSSAYGGGSTSTQAQTQTAVATVKTAKVKLGTIVVDGSGHTLYLFEKDQNGTSACTGACAKVWSPLTTGAAPQSGGGAQSAMLGTIKRPDGTMQVTYAGHPLYHYDDDHKPGQAEGQGEKAFGASWYVVAPSGKKIDES